MPFDLARIASGLPFASAVPDLQQACAAGVFLVEAPPGSGKTTLAPAVIANTLAADGRLGRIVVTQPRRVAVRAAARRLAALSGTELGDLVGFSVRGESQTSRSTVVEFVTPGLLLRRLLADPELSGVAAVVLDEVHERSLDTDLLLGMLAEVRSVRDDLLLAAMSATLNVEIFREALSGTAQSDDVPTVACAAPPHPLDVVWSPAPENRTDARGVSPVFLDHVAQCVRDQLLTAPPGADMSPPDSHGESPLDDVLVFLPGVREVERVTSLLGGTPGVEVLPLHGRLTPGEQDRITAGRRPDQPRRVIVSTALAESSLTVPGVSMVVDAGLSREPRRDAARGMSGLVTVACSRASAEQRAGRAARLGPGRVVRCYNEETFARMPAQVTPEILTADLTDAALTLAAWGTPGAHGLALPTAPPAAALRDAMATLAMLGATSDDGALTPLGRVMAEIPTAPRLGRALLEGAEEVGAQRCAEVVAALTDDLRVPSADLASALSGLSGQARQRWKRESDRLQRLAARPNIERTASRESPDIPRELIDGFIVALAYPDRIARRSENGVYLLTSGTRAALPPDSPLRHHEWLAVADVGRASGRIGRGTGAVIRLAAPLSRELAESVAQHLRVDEVRSTWSDGRVTARRVQALGAIELSATPTRPPADGARQAVATALRADGLTTLGWNEAASALRNRLAFCHRHLGAPWPDVSDSALLDRLDEWLGPELELLARGTRVEKLNLVEPLRRLLPWPDAAHLDELVPERLQVPSGSRIRITYPSFDDDAPAVVAVKLQECFGLTTTPRIAGGRSALVFHLLSPAGRPLAITDDLASFWSGPYAGVRADMRGRYPRHPWPEDPSTHVATARTKNRL